MEQLSSMFSGLARSFSMKNKKSHFSGCGGGGDVTAMANNKEDKKIDLILKKSGTVEGPENFAAIYSKRGQKGVNQDSCIVWEEFGCQEDMMFCGIFDGHGQWGHYVAKCVRESMPTCLLCSWQETLAESALEQDDVDLESEKKFSALNIWKHSYLKTCASVDRMLKTQRKFDSFNSGTTALTIVRQGEFIFVANVGDSRAVLATTGNDGNLVAVPLTTDFKPNLPEEAERIMKSGGRVFCLEEDEPGVHRVWLPDEDSPGLAMSRAFGDFCFKDFGLSSVPEVSQRHITSKDQFAILATDGVWDVISNQKAVQIVSSISDRAKAAKFLVQFAAREWRRKRREIAMDDISAIVLYFHKSDICTQIHPESTSK